MRRMARMGRWLAAAAVLLLAALCALAGSAAPAHAASQPADLRNAEDSPLGRVELAPYTAAPGGEAAVVARLHVADPAAWGGARWVQFSLESDAPGVRLHVDALATASGTPVPVQQDPRREARLESTRLVLPADLVQLAGGPGKPLTVVLSGHAKADLDGRFQVGALAIGFRPDWSVPRHEGERLDLYGFTVLGSEGSSKGALEPPVAGQGNARLAAGAVLAVVALESWLLSRLVRTQRAQRWARHGESR